MRFLSVAERELRAAARHKSLYHIRWTTTAAFFVLLLWFGWAFDVFQNRSTGPKVFQAFSILMFVYALFVGATGTADCLSREKREGTLGLLFLTNLNSPEIVAGKLCANALAAIYSLLAIFPVLALPMLIGGVTFGYFWRTVLALANAIFFAVAAGFVASAFSFRQFPAVALATGLVLFFGLGLAGIAAILRKFGCPSPVSDGVAAFCPLHTLLSASGSGLFRSRWPYWSSLAVVAGMSWMWLVLAAWRVGRTWRDRPKAAHRWSRLGLGPFLRRRGSATRLALRRRFLDINPLFWLAGRQRVSAPGFMLLTVLLVLLTVEVTVPLFGRVVGAGAASPMLGHLFAWFWTGLAIHALVLYYGATVASQRLAEDKQTGALELILSTPTSERSISRGLWLAYGRRMLFPALIAVLIHLYFIWQCMVMFVLEPPGELPPHTTAWQLFRAALLDQPIQGQVLDWQFGFLLRIVLLLLVLLMANWLAFGWVGRWLGLRMKHPGFAPMVAVALVVVPPVLLFSLLCYLSEKWHISRMPERQFLPMMMWIGFGVGLGNCVLLSAWAAMRLRFDFRTTVTSRFQPPSSRRWWRPDGRTVLRFAAATAVVAVALVLMVLLFYGYQNWQVKRRWAAFQTRLKQQGESLDLSAFVAKPVPAEQNFARAPAFQNLMSPRRAEPAAIALLRDSLKYTQVDPAPGPRNSGPLIPWIQQGFLDLDAPLAWITPNRHAVTATTRAEAASEVWNGLRPLQENLGAVAVAARLPFFQTSPRRDAAAVLQSHREDLWVMEQLHFLFELRACALLALNRSEEAGEDVSTSLRLAQLARQSPDAKGPLRVQTLVARSLQPIWEGLAAHRWNESQLAAFQQELARFDLLSDHTNGIRRVVLAHLETWRSIADGSKGRMSVPEERSLPDRQSELGWQPRLWWYDNCIQLDQAGQNAIARVDVAGGRVSFRYNWSDLSGLPLDSAASQLLQQANWLGAGPALVSFAQTAVNQAVIACALERYRLAHGTVPDKLDRLIPGYLPALPRDVACGRPMIYQRNANDSYILRSVGPNEINDQGRMPSDDWLWSFTPVTNTPSAAGGRRQ